MATLLSGTLLIDNSSVELLTTCPTKANYAILMRRKLAVEQPALRFGGHIHAALAYRYKREGFRKPWSQDKQLRVLSNRFLKTPCDNEDWRNLDTASNVIRLYNKQRMAEPFEVERLPRFYNLPFVEKPFAVNMGVLRGIKVVYIGRIDLLIRYPGEGLFVMDHKTTSMLGDSFWEDLQMSEQQRGYCYAVRELIGEEPTGYVVNVLACRRPTKTGVAVEFARQRFYTKVPGGQLDAWRDNMLSQVETFLWHIERKSFPQHHKHCVHKYGTCEFKRVCEQPKEHRLSTLMSADYTNNDWTPLYR